MTLQAHEVSKRFGGVKALSDCSFIVKPGTITALIGPNGSGKSTMFNVISRLISEDTGKVSLAGKPSTHKKDFQVARRAFSRTFQHVRLFPNLNIQDHLEIALRRKDESMWSSLLKKETIPIEQIKKILKLVGLEMPLHTIANELSYGQRKLLDLAITLAKTHAVLLLDEPVAGVNPLLRKEIKQILQKLRNEGETILLIEHDMNFVMDLADYIFVLDNGKVIAEGIPKIIQNNRQVLDAYLGV